MANVYVDFYCAGLPRDWTNEQAAEYGLTPYDFQSPFFNYRVGYMKDTSTMVMIQEGETLSQWPEFPDIPGYVKDGYGYYTKDPSTNENIGHALDTSTETIDREDTHASSIRGSQVESNDTVYFSYYYSDASSVPVVTYQANGVTIATETIGRFTTELNPPSGYTWNLPQSLPTEDTVITGTANSVNLTITLVNRPYTYEQPLNTASKTFVLNPGDNIDDFIAAKAVKNTSAYDDWVYEWYHYDPTYVPLWGTLTVSEYPQTMPMQDLTITRTYNIAPEHYHNLTIEFYERDATATETLVDTVVQNLPYGTIVLNVLSPWSVYDGPWKTVYNNHLNTGYSYYKTVVETDGTYLEPDMQGPILKDADMTLKVYSAYGAFNITTVFKKGDEVIYSHSDIVREGDTLDGSRIPYVGPAPDGYERVNRTVVVSRSMANQEVVIAEFVKKYNVNYCFNNDTSNVIETVLVTAGKQIPEYSPRETIKVNDQVYRYSSMTYPQSVVDGIMPNEDINVSLTYIIMDAKVSFVVYDGENVHNTYTVCGVPGDTVPLVNNWGQSETYAPEWYCSDGQLFDYELFKWKYRDFFHHIDWSDDAPSVFPSSGETITVTGSYIVNETHFIYFVDNRTGRELYKKPFQYMEELRYNPETTEFTFVFYNIKFYVKDDMSVYYMDMFDSYRMPNYDFRLDVREYNTSEYRLTYYSGEDVIKTEYYYETEPIEPLVYHVDGYEFKGWRGIPEVMPASDVNVTAILEEIRIPIFNLSYKIGDEIWRTVQVESGSTIIREIPHDIPQGYTFVGWTPDLTTMPNFDVTLTAELKEIPIVRNKHIITFIIDGKIIEKREIYSNDQIAVPTVNCEDGYRVKWGNFPFIMPDEDIEITGTLVKMEPKMYKATYVIDGKAYSAVNYYVGDSVFEKEAPEVEGYTFSGWKDIPEKMPASDITITGEYVKSDSLSRYSVIYKINDKIYRSKIVDAGSRVDIIDYPTKNGYVFSGWSISESFEMPDHDVEIVGVFTVGGETGKYTINYYVEGEPLRKKSRAASNKTYDLYASDEYFTGETINLPAEPTSDNKVFLGWSGLTTTMPDENVNVYAKFATRGVESLTEVYKMPVIREKLINSSSGNVRPGNKLETVLLPESDYTVDDEVIKIRRVAVVTPDGQQQDTSYYLTSTRAAEIYGETEDSETESYIKIGDEFYDCVVRGDGTFNVYTTQPEDMPETYYELTDRVTYENGVFYEIIKTPEGSSEEYVKGNELYIRQRDRAVYGKFQDGKPTLLEDEQGYFTNWVYKFTLYNNHNTEVYYYQTLERKDLETIKVYTKTYDTIVEYTPVITDAIYNYQWYPKGDFANLPDDAIELASAGITKTDYVNVGAALDGNVLTIFFISAVDAADGYSVIYIMDGDDRIAMLTGNEGDTISYPTELKKTGYKFKGFEQPVPTVFAHNPQSVMTVWEKDEDALPEPDADVVKHKVTWMIPDYNWKYQILVEVGADIPSAPDPGISNITVTSWLLKSTVFTGNKMPDFDVTYEAVYRETGEPTVDQYRITYTITYTTTTNNTVSETYASYLINVDAPITPEPAPYKRGGTFNGWSEIPAYMPAHNVEITGTFTGQIAEQYNINYFVDGVIYKTVVANIGDAITPEPEPTKTGFVFSGWVGLPEYMPSYELNVNGYFIADSDSKVKVTYKVDGEVYKTYNMIPGTPLPAEPEPTRQGKVFSGWYPIVTTVPEYDVVISGQFRDATTVTYTCEFYLNEELYSKYKYAAGETIVQPEVTIVGFTGWKNCPAKMPQKDLKIYGTVVSEQAYTITYMVDNEVFTTQSKMPGDVIVAPRAEREGYEFSGWQGLPADMRMPAENLTVTGSFTESQSSYTITFKYGETVIYTTTLAVGADITTPEPPAVEGKTFSKWNGLPADMKMPRYNLTIVAVYVNNEDVPTTQVTGTYYLTVVQRDGTTTRNQYRQERYTPGDTMVYIANPTRESYTFGSWTSTAVVDNKVPSTDFDIEGTLSEGGPYIFWTLWVSESDKRILKTEYCAPGTTIVEPDGAALMQQMHVSIFNRLFDKWDSHVEVMPDENLTIYGRLKVDVDTFTVYVFHEYVNADDTKDRYDVSSYQLESGAPFEYPPAPSPDANHSDYIFAGWSGWDRSEMAASNVEIVGTFYDPSKNHGGITGYVRLNWYLPRFGGDQLSPHRTFYSFSYCQSGAQMIPPADVADYISDDGYMYHVTGWDLPYDGIAPQSNWSAVIDILATVERVEVQYDIDFYLNYYDDANTYRARVPFMTVQAYPGEDLVAIKQQATDAADEIEGYMFSGQWKYNEVVTIVDDKMPWRNIALNADIYSFEYAESNDMIKPLNYRLLRWKTKSYILRDGNRVAIFNNNEYTIYKEWKRIGATITEPEAPEEAPFEHGSQFLFDGWEEHDNVMPSNDLTIYAKWKANRGNCVMTWRIEVIAADDTSTFETYRTQTLVQGDFFEILPDPAERAHYIWAGWDMGIDQYYWDKVNWVVPYEDEVTYTGKFIHENSSYRPSGYVKAIYRLRNHNLSYSDDQYITYYTVLAKSQGEVPECPTTPEDWLGADGYMYHFLGWEEHADHMGTVGDMYITALDERVAVEYKINIYIKYQGGPEYNSREEYWKYVTAYPGDLIEPILDENEPTVPSGHVWDGIWHGRGPNMGYQNMPWKDIDVYTTIYEESYFIEIMPDSDYFHVVKWVSPYHKGYWRPQDRWIVKQEVVREGATLVPPTGVVMPDHEDEYELTGWLGLPADMKMPDNNVTFEAVWYKIPRYSNVHWAYHLKQEDGSIINEDWLVEELEIGSEFTLRTPPGKDGYIWTGWEPPYNDTVTYIVGDYEDQYIYGNMTSSQRYEGPKDGYGSIFWRVPTYTPNQLDDEWRTWRFSYVKAGNKIIDPTDTPENLTDTSGVECEFVRWKVHDTYAVSRRQVDIDAVYERIMQKYKCTYYILFSNSRTLKKHGPIKYREVMYHPGDNIQLKPVVPSPWYLDYYQNEWRGWLPLNYQTDTKHETMPWKDIDVYCTFICEHATWPDFPEELVFEHESDDPQPGKWHNTKYIINFVTFNNSQRVNNFRVMTTRLYLEGKSIVYYPEVPEGWEILDKNWYFVNYDESTSSWISTGDVASVQLDQDMDIMMTMESIDKVNPVDVPETVDWEFKYANVYFYIDSVDGYLLSYYRGQIGTEIAYPTQIDIDNYFISIGQATKRLVGWKPKVQYLDAEYKGVAWLDLDDDENKRTIDYYINDDLVAEFKVYPEEDIPVPSDELLDEYFYSKGLTRTRVRRWIQTQSTSTFTPKIPWIYVADLTGYVYLTFEERNFDDNSVIGIETIVANVGDTIRYPARLHAQEFTSYNDTTFNHRFVGCWENLTKLLIAGDPSVRLINGSTVSETNYRVDAEIIVPDIDFYDWYYTGIRTNLTEANAPYGFIPVDLLLPKYNDMVINQRQTEITGETVVAHALMYGFLEYIDHYISCDISGYNNVAERQSGSMWIGLDDLSRYYANNNYHYTVKYFPELPVPNNVYSHFDNDESDYDSTVTTVQVPAMAYIDVYSLFNLNSSLSDMYRIISKSENDSEWTNTQYTKMPNYVVDFALKLKEDAVITYGTRYVMFPTSGNERVSGKVSFNHGNTYVYPEDSVDDNGNLKQGGYYPPIVPNKKSSYEYSYMMNTDDAKYIDPTRVFPFIQRMYSAYHYGEIFRLFVYTGGTKLRYSESEAIVTLKDNLRWDEWDATKGPFLYPHKKCYVVFRQYYESSSTGTKDEAWSIQRTSGCSYWSEEQLNS